MAADAVKVDADAQPQLKEVLTLECNASRDGFSAKNITDH